MEQKKQLLALAAQRGVSPGLLAFAVLSGPISVLAQTKTAAAPSLAANSAQTVNGPLEGSTTPSGVHLFKGGPFAPPPVLHRLRRHEPQPVQNWITVRSVQEFGPRLMQQPLFGDMDFRSKGVSEDYFYLNVWTATKSAKEHRPVLVYFYGGAVARRGIVPITVNYRLGVFGFLAHPELSRKSPHQVSGNYGFLDQSAALRWVQQNIAALGGHPKLVTIAGESAGAMSVSAQMASPLSKNLFARAIGESGSMLNTSFGHAPLAQVGQAGLAFATSLGAASLAALRALPAQQLLEAAGEPGTPRFAPTLDQYFFTAASAATFAAGQQAWVPLLVGWNSQEMSFQALLGFVVPTPESYRAAVQKLYGERAGAVLKLYPADTAAEAEQSAADLAGDRFIAYSTWKWAGVQSSSQLVYRFKSRARPTMTPEMGNATAGLAGGLVKQTPSAPKAPPARGAVHSAEI